MTTQQIDTIPPRDATNVPRPPIQNLLLRAVQSGHRSFAHNRQHCSGRVNTVMGLASLLSGARENRYESILMNGTSQDVPLGTNASVPVVRPRRSLRIQVAGDQR